MISLSLSLRTEARGRWWYTMSPQLTQTLSPQTPPPTSSLWLSARWATLHYYSKVSLSPPFFSLGFVFFVQASLWTRAWVSKLSFYFVSMSHTAVPLLFLLLFLLFSCLNHFSFLSLSPFLFCFTNTFTFSVPPSPLYLPFLFLCFQIHFYSKFPHFSIVVLGCVLQEVSVSLGYSTPVCVRSVLLQYRGPSLLDLEPPLQVERGEGGREGGRGGREYNMCVCCKKVLVE